MIPRTLSVFTRLRSAVFTEVHTPNLWCHSLHISVRCTRFLLNQQTQGYVHFAKVANIHSSRSVRVVVVRDRKHSVLRIDPRRARSASKLHFNRWICLRFSPLLRLIVCRCSTTALKPRREKASRVGAIAHKPMGSLFTRSKATCESSSGIPVRKFQRSSLVSQGTERSVRPR